MIKQWGVKISVVKMMSKHKPTEEGPGLPVTQQLPPRSSSGAEPDLLDRCSCTKAPALSILDPSNRIPDL